jgi:hypothetical protein
VAFVVIDEFTLWTWLLFLFSFFCEDRIPDRDTIGSASSLLLLLFGVRSFLY